MQDDSLIAQSIAIIAQHLEAGRRKMTKHMQFANKLQFANGQI